MATLVCFHAHPDDEAISTGGTIAGAAAAGHRVVLVLATGGEHGEVPDDLAPGETLSMRRQAETAESAKVLGVARVVWLGYQDSGMTGWEQNEHPHSFWQAPLDEAAERLATVLLEEDAMTLTTYDWHGNYGHPDHIQVHRVGHRAAEMAGTPHVYDATMNRDHMTRMFAVQRAQAEAARLSNPDAEVSSNTPDWNPDDPADDGNPFGMTEAELTTAIDVSAWIHAKKASVRCHRSQISDSGFFSSMPDEAFVMGFGTEWFIRKGAPGGITESSLAGVPF